MDGTQLWKPNCTFGLSWFRIFLKFHSTDIVTCWSGDNNRRYKVESGPDLKGLDGLKYQNFKVLLQPDIIIAYNSK